MEKLRRQQATGFSLVEMMMVVVIVLTVSAISIPAVLRSMRTYRLSSTAREVAKILQRTRYEAIRRNTTIPWRTQPQNNTSILWIDSNNNNVIDPTEPIVLLPPDVQFVSTGVVPGPASMGSPGALPPWPGAAGFPPPPTAAVSFDARGTVNFGAGAPPVYVIYLGYPQQPTYGYRAVTLTPMGQTKVWSAATGGTWHSP